MQVYQSDCTKRANCDFTNLEIKSSGEATGELKPPSCLQGHQLDLHKIDDKFLGNSQSSASTKLLTAVKMYQNLHVYVIFYTFSGMEANSSDPHNPTAKPMTSLMIKSFTEYDSKQCQPGKSLLVA